MKNFTLLKKSMPGRIAFAILMLTGALTWAQTVTVPSGCTVVVAGTGGTLGASGTVGDGGVVIMADPGGGGIFTFNPPSGVTSANWFLNGDLSNSTASPFYNAPTQPSAGLTANIITYNKNFRSASSEGLNPSWARSKGQVRVSYSVPGCGSSIAFEIYKTFGNIPAIVGPTCLEPNKTYTYSIDQVASDNANDNIGFDKYYWSGLPVGAINSYFSADNSSITFTTPASFPPFTLKCCVGRYNTSSNVDGGNGPIPSGSVTYTTCTTAPVYLGPTAPAYTTAPPTCHPTGASLFTIVYPNPTSGIYTWTAPNTGWVISSSSTATTTTITVATPNNNPGGLVLTITGTPCNSTVTIPYQVNRSLTGSIIIPGTTSPGSICMLAGSSNNQFNLGAASANSTVWTLSSTPAGATGVSLSSVAGQPSSTVAVNIASNATINATYTLTATASTSPACNATSATYTFNVRPLTPTITGTACVVKGALTPRTYTCTASNGASYNWVFPSGWTAGSFTTTTNSITVTPASATAVLNGNATVTATGLSGCNSATSAPFAINYSPVAPILGATTCMNVGATTASVAISNAQTFGNYTVTSSPVGITSSGVITSGSLALTIPPTLAAGTYSITVFHNAVGACGSASTVLSNITVGASGAAWATGFPSYDPTVGGSDVYRVNAQPAGTTYQWYSGPSVYTSIATLTLIPSPGSNPYASFSPSGNQMTLYGDTALTNPQVYCVVIPPSGCRTIISAPKGAHGTSSRLANPNAKNLSKGEGVIIYPNPNDGNFYIQVDNVKEKANARLTDMTGKVLATYILNKGENKIENKNLAAGTYNIILQIDGKTENRQLIVK
ncbi:T9SS type A sorting domain-containing protein [Flavobacterium psychrotrophum]|uniref:T9SS type A sorting domain-containing protein n=1 Tax=Flavobacterium psychrotrophum TaxID=2294119 RepID=UPI000E31C345|nr:T9SS type A sorting domain-containing protein [Flavobacterium psychrotrophum]